MADLDSINTDERQIEDPIAEAQIAVFEAKALLECISAVVEANGSSYIQPDLLAAVSGVVRLLGEVGDNLDPRQFRKAVLASTGPANG